MVGRPKNDPFLAAFVSMAESITPQSDYLTLACKPLINKVVSHTKVTNAANRARVAFPSRDDVARYAILAGRNE